MHILTLSALKLNVVRLVGFDVMQVFADLWWLHVWHEVLLDFDLNMIVDLGVLGELGKDTVPPRQTQQLRSGNHLNGVVRLYGLDYEPQGALELGVQVILVQHAQELDSGLDVVVVLPRAVIEEEVSEEVSKEDGPLFTGEVANLFDDKAHISYLLKELNFTLIDKAYGYFEIDHAGQVPDKLPDEVDVIAVLLEEHGEGNFDWLNRRLMEAGEDEALLYLKRQGEVIVELVAWFGEKLVVDELCEVELKVVLDWQEELLGVAERTLEVEVEFPSKSIDVLLMVLPEANDILGDHF